MLAEESVKPAMVSSDITLEWKTYHRYIAQQPKEDMKVQLKELTINSILIAMLPNLSTIVNISLSIPVGTACVTKLFSNEDDQNTTKKLPGRNDFIIMKIAVESPKKCLIETWKRSLMPGTESHDGSLCKIRNLHTLREGGNSKDG